MIGVGRDGPVGGGSAVVGSAAGTGDETRTIASQRPGVSNGLSEREALAVLATVGGVGPVTLARLIDRFGGAARAIVAARDRDAVRLLVDASRDPDGPGHGIAAKVAQRIVEASTRAEEILRGLERANVRVVTLEDEVYPARLRAIDLPPHVLFVRGDPAALGRRRAVAVVGTRRPSDAGRRVAARIATGLVRAGASVVSGLAIGIDGAAHAAAVAEHGITVAVLGGGHDHLFPPGHRRLADAIVGAGGAVISELPPDQEPTPGSFPRRNRVISGLTEATVVVEAGARSGALLTACWALEQGRECFLVPGPIDSLTSAGCLGFLREFAGQARIVSGIPQLLEDLGLTDLPDPLDGAALEPPVAAVLVELGEGARRVAAALLRDRTTTDELVATTGMPIAAVLGALTLLEARHLVVSAYGRYRPAGRLAGAPTAG